MKRTCIKPDAVVPGLLSKTCGGIEPPYTDQPYKRRIILPMKHFNVDELPKGAKTDHRPGWKQIGVTTLPNQPREFTYTGGAVTWAPINAPVFVPVLNPGVEVRGADCEPHSLGLGS